MATTQEENPTPEEIARMKEIIRQGWKVEVPKKGKNDRPVEIEREPAIRECRVGSE